MIKKVLVLGGGSAGFIAAINLKAKAPQLDVLVVRSKELGIIGVGEGSTVGLPPYLHRYIGMDTKEFYAVAKPVWKLGIRFVNWGPRSHFHYTFAAHFMVRWNEMKKHAGYYMFDDDMIYTNMNSSLMEANRAFVRRPDGAPDLKFDWAYHLENHDYVNFLETYATRIGVRILDDTVEHVKQDERGHVSALVLKSGNTETADLYVDSSGFFSLLLGKTLKEPYISFKPTLFCDRAVVGGWDRPEGEPIQPYTVAETMDAGWAWRIDHEHRINRGYVYSSSFISDEAAEREFRTKNPKVGPTRIVKFLTGRYERAWVKNVCAVGNAGGFVEPLEATSLAAIADQCQVMSDVLLDSDFDPSESQIKHFNNRQAFKWDNIRRFLGVHYKYNTALDTEFWRAAREKTDLYGAEEVVEYYQDNGPSIQLRESYLNKFDQFGMEGYLALLVGQKVPYKRKFEPPASDLQLWSQIKNSLKSRAHQGYTIQEALAYVKHPSFKWPDPSRH
jgi:tryptophan halogenase